MSTKLQSSFKSTFNEILLSSIINGLESFNKGMSNVVINFIRESKGIELQEIPNCIETFVDSLEEIFGLGSVVIERIIFENIEKEFQLMQESGEYSFFDSTVANIKEQVERNKGIYNLKDRVEIVKHAFIMCVKLLELREKLD